MKTKNILDAMNGVDFELVEDAGKQPAIKKNSRTWVKWGAMAACLCLLAGGITMFYPKGTKAPNPEPVQVTNPIMEVASVEEMEQYLDFKVPVLNKKVSVYMVLVIDNYPEMGRIKYADGALFSMKYGTGDISGVYGAELVKTEQVNGITVSYYESSMNSYAAWEKDGFTYSLSGGDSLEEDVQELLK